MFDNFLQGYICKNIIKIITISGYISFDIFLFIL